MFCNQCGNKMPDDAAFCPVCGTKKEVVAQAEEVKVEQTVAEVKTEVKEQEAAEVKMEQAATEIKTDLAAANAAPNPVPNAVPVEKAAKDKKGGFSIKLLVPIAAAFVVVVLLLILVLAGGGSKQKIATYTHENVVDFTYVSSEGSYFANFAGEKYESDEEVYDYRYNADHSVSAYVERVDGEYNLYYIKSDLKPELIMEDVHNYSFGISYTGEYIYFLQDVEDNYSGTLYLYCVKNGKITQVDTDVYADYICLSPSGKAVSYMKDYENYDDNTLYVGGDGIKNKEIDDDGCRTVALTDNGKTVYYLNEDYKLYIFNGKESEKIESDVDTNIWFNEDITELLYTKNGNTYFYTTKMEEAEKVCGSSMYGIEMSDDAVSYYANYSTIIGTESLKGCVLETYDGSLYWLNEKGDGTVRITSSASEYQVSEDGKSMIYVMNGDVYKIKQLGEKMESEKLYDDDYVDYVFASKDLSSIYVTCSDELYYIKGTDKAERISNDLSDDYYGYINSVAYNDASGKIYFIENGTLKVAGKTEKSAKEVVEDAVFVMDMMDGVLYAVEDNDEYTYYYITKKDAIEVDFY